MADDFINKAKTVIGTSADDDYILAPIEHAKEYKDTASDLADILISSAVEGTAEQYVERDKIAIAAQAEFRRIFERANKLIFATAIFSALVLAVSIVFPAIPHNPLVKQILLVGFSLLTAIFGALASRDLNIINNGELLKDWTAKRSDAEGHRLDYFYQIAQSIHQTTKGSIPVDLLKLEYFRRYQLDMQMAFYRSKSQANKEMSKKILFSSSLAIAGASMATAFAGVLGAINGGFAAIAAFGTIFIAFSSYSATREEIYQYRRNAERYDRTLKILEDIRKKIDHVRQAVFLAGQKPLTDFIDAVHEQLSLEHSQWLGEQSQALSAVAKLEETLKKYTSGQEARPVETNNS
ncbi:MAG TPA: SLATT domain-containing protein [Pyrinomonadaceae bacterium]